MGTCTLLGFSGMALGTPVPTSRYVVHLLRSSISTHLRLTQCFTSYCADRVSFSCITNSALYKADVDGRTIVEARDLNRLASRYFGTVGKPTNKMAVFIVAIINIIITVRQP